MARSNRRRSAEWFASNTARERDILAHPARPSGGPYMRLGARVIVRSPQGSRYDGQTGTVRAIGQSIMVELDASRATLPFGPEELVALSSVTRGE